MKTADTNTGTGYQPSFQRWPLSTGLMAVCFLLSAYAFLADGRDNALFVCCALTAGGGAVISMSWELIHRIFHSGPNLPARNTCQHLPDKDDVGICIAMTCIFCLIYSACQSSRLGNVHLSVAPAYEEGRQLWVFPPDDLEQVLQKAANGTGYCLGPLENAETMFQIKEQLEGYYHYEIEHIAWDSENRQMVIIVNTIL